MYIFACLTCLILDCLMALVSCFSFLMRCLNLFHPSRLYRFFSFAEATQVMGSSAAMTLSGSNVIHQFPIQSEHSIYCLSNWDQSLLKDLCDQLLL